MEDRCCIDFDAGNRTKGRNWFTVAVAGIDKCLFIRGTADYNDYLTFNYWYEHADDSSCVVSYSNGLTLYVPKRSILWFSDNGIYMEGDEK